MVNVVAGTVRVKSSPTDAWPGLQPHHRRGRRRRRSRDGGWEGWPHYSFLSFFRGPMNAALSCGVWKRPWPNLELVSMNFRDTFSMYLFLVWVRRDFLRVSTLFLCPMQAPLSMMKSCFTSPEWGNPPMGLMDVSARSDSVAALFLI